MTKPTHTTETIRAAMDRLVDRTAHFDVDVNAKGSFFSGRLAMPPLGDGAPHRKE